MAGNKFWSNATATPKRNYRWLVYMNDKIIWWAKTATVPSYEVSEVEHDFMDNKYYYPGRVTWSEISLTLVDPLSPDATSDTLEILNNSGYKVKEFNDLESRARTISKATATKSGLKGLRMILMDADGNQVEEWTMMNPFVKSAKYGDLDYSNDELRTVEMTIRYDWAECSFKAPSDGKEFKPTSGGAGIGAGDLFGE